MMVPNGWYPGYPQLGPASRWSRSTSPCTAGTASGINADVAEAYSVGQIVAQAVTATRGTDNAKIIAYLHSGVTLNSVQGPVTFDALGENGAAAAFVFQWQKGNFDPGPAEHRRARRSITKTPWTDAATTLPTPRRADPDGRGRPGQRAGP